MNKQYNPLLRLNAILDGSYIPESLRVYICNKVNDIKTRTGVEILCLETKQQFISLNEATIWLHNISQTRKTFNRVYHNLSCRLKETGKTFYMGYTFIRVIYE